MQSSSLKKGLATSAPSSSRLIAAPRRVGQIFAQPKGAPKDASAIGFKWDGSNLRWVRDDRYIGVEQQTMIVPKSGTPYTVWPVIHAELTARNLQSVTAAEAAKMQQQGWTLLDVRLEGDFDASHAADSVNISLYRFTAGNELWDKIKRVAMAGFAMKATERDPDFADKVAARFKKNQKLIVVCAIGGTLDTKLRLRPDKYKDGVKDLDRSFGRESRSLKACYQLMKAGWTSSNLVFMEGGVQQWRFQGFPVEASA
ncbi:hypothetical protein QJQ45_017897 [Haematococcus lacustris]|nr:hypothetical protein QJQ45_017897 [Haematococcus lacustris]